MDTGQLAIKIILIIGLAAFAIFLMIPGRGVRHLAIRRLVMVLLIAVVVLAVVFPSGVTTVAHFLGVGRGADLLLYGLIVVFVGNSILQQRRHRHTERDITELARQLAILQAPDAARAFASVDDVPTAPAPAEAAGPAAASVAEPGDLNESDALPQEVQRPVS